MVAGSARSRDQITAIRLGSLDGQRSHEDLLDDAENGCVYTDRERQRAYGGERQPGARRRTRRLFRKSDSIDGTDAHDE